MAKNDIQYLAQQYKNAFTMHGDSKLSLMWSGCEHDNRFFALTSSINKESFSVLDYGCGLAHLKLYLDGKYKNYSYYGVDIVAEFIEYNKQKYKDSAFKSIKNVYDIDSDEMLKAYDYIFVSGVFNILFKDSHSKQLRYIKNTLKYLFEKTNVYLAVNFMHTDVDYTSQSSYHQDIVQIYNFVVTNLSKRLIIDRSYMPYEFTIKIFKDDARLGNVYSEAIE